jgi:hypothetical protein
MYGVNRAATGAACGYRRVTIANVSLLTEHGDGAVSGDTLDGRRICRATCSVNFMDGYGKVGPVEITQRFPPDLASLA